MGDRMREKNRVCAYILRVAAGRMTLRQKAVSFLSLFLVLTLLPVLPVRAGSGEESDAPWDERFEEQSWDELVEQLIRDCHLSGEVALGYKNTVTGEEHYYNGDTYITGASLYKTPLNMYYAEQIHLGNKSWDDPVLAVTYREAQRSSLTYSNNNASLTMLQSLGGWKSFRELVAGYLGESAENSAYMQAQDTFTARQMTHCMDLLCTESDRFPGVMDCLLDSAPGKFLKMAEVDYPIAQKYGTVGAQGNRYFHAAGIVYTEDPIALAVLTVNVGNQGGILKGFTELMCEYTEYFTARRKAGEAEEPAAQETEEPAVQEAEEPAAREAEEPAAQEAEEPAVRGAEEPAVKESPAHAPILAALLVVTLLAAILFFRWVIRSGRRCVR